MNAVEMLFSMRADITGMYREVAERLKHTTGEEVSLLIADAERKHLDMHSQLMHGLSLLIQEFHPMEIIKTIFDEMKYEMMERSASATEKAEVLRIAARMEKRSIEFYRRAASETSFEEERRLFERLADEGEHYCNSFTNTRFFMNNSESWYLWDEFSIADGGTQWA